jgi:putative heme uptake system protein
MSARRTFLLVDGENIDATLGSSVLGRRPEPDERPRWDRVLAYAERIWDQPVTGLFFLNASGGQLPTAFVQALVTLGFRPVPLAGDEHEKVVDLGIQRTLEAIAGLDGDVLLCSHDGDFAPYLSPLLEGRRRAGLLGFREFMSSQLRALDLDIHDLEDDVHAFKTRLPRLRIIPLAEFDPLLFLRD